MPASSFSLLPVHSDYLVFLMNDNFYFYFFVFNLFTINTKTWEHVINKSTKYVQGTDIWNACCPKLLHTRNSQYDWNLLSRWRQGINFTHNQIYFPSKLITLIVVSWKTGYLDFIVTVTILVEFLWFFKKW